MDIFYRTNYNPLNSWMDLGGSDNKTIVYY